MYDENGNTIEKDGPEGFTSYTWNDDDRLVQSTTPTGAVSYTYDNLGIRQSATRDGVTTNYLVDPNRDYAEVIAEEATTGNASVLYTHADELVSQQRSGTYSYYHADGLGSVRLLTDDTSSTTDTYIYLAFGDIEAQTGSTVNDYLFTGEQFDPNLGFYYLRARYLDTSIGRFVSKDSWMGDNLNPITLNKYLYANSDPALYNDPTGHFGLSSGFGAASSIRGTLASISTPSFVANIGRTVLAVARISGRIIAKTGIRVLKYCIKKKNKCGLRTNLLIVGNNHPDMINHIRSAQASRPRTIMLTYMPNKKRKNGWYNGKGGCALQKPASNYQCDEYPMHRTREGGPENWPSRVSLEWVPGDQNMSVGGYFGALAKGMKKSRKYKFFVITTHEMKTIALPLAKRK